MKDIIDKLKLENAELRKLIIKSRHTAYEIEARNDRMKNISWFSVLISFIVSYAVGFVIIGALCTNVDIIVKIKVSVLLWFTTWTTFYFSWRYDNKKKDIDA